MDEKRPDEANLPLPTAPDQTNSVKRASKRRWIIILILLLGAPAIFVLYLYLSSGTDLSKGVKDYSLSKREVETDFSSIEKGMGLTAPSKSNYADCYEGQNNYKVRTGYRVRCSFKQTRYYAFDTDFKTTLQKLETTIINSGWQARKIGPNFPLGNTLDYYSERYNGRDYLVSNLPGPVGDDFKKKSSSGLGMREMEINFGEKGSAQSDIETGFISNQIRISDCCGSISEYGDGNFTSKDFATITAEHRYIMAVSIVDMYFQR